MSEFKLSEFDASVLTANRALAEYFEAVTAATNEPKLSANWVSGELASYLNKQDMSVADSPVGAEQLASLIARITDNTISGKIAKDVFEAMWNGGGTPDEIIEAKGLKQITDTGAIETLIDGIIAANPGQYEQYRSGKDKLFGFFVGQVMRESKGKANPAEVNRLLKAKLDA
jgi:aspartyl-tRNA(Asn)/glutamyl-tRNA(Gln) amidotransferase subunit B